MTVDLINEHKIGTGSPPPPKQKKERGRPPRKFRLVYCHTGEPWTQKSVEILRDVFKMSAGEAEEKVRFACEHGAIPIMDGWYDIVQTKNRTRS